MSRMGAYRCAAPGREEGVARHVVSEEMKHFKMFETAYHTEKADGESARFPCVWF